MNRSLSHTQVAKILSVDGSSITNYERGTRKLDQDQIVTLVKALNTTADCFLGLSKTKEKRREYEMIKSFLFYILLIGYAIISCVKYIGFSIIDNTYCPPIEIPFLFLIVSKLRVICTLG